MGSKLDGEFIIRIRTVLARRLVGLDEIDTAVSAYETLFGQPARLRFEYPDKGLRIAQVAQLLLIGGNAAALEPFRDTDMTFLVDDIEGYANWLPSTGAEIVRPVQRVPSGHNMLVRQADGALIEYVQHDHPNASDDNLTNPL